MADYFTFKFNKNKTVKLTPVGTRSDEYGESTWRSNLYFLLKGALATGAQDAEKLSLINSSLKSSNLNVKGEVELLMENKAPALEASVEVKEGFSDLMTQVENTFSKLGTFNKALSTGLDIYTRVASLVEGLDNSNTATSNTFNPWALKAPTWDDSKIDSVKEFSYTFKFRMGQYGLWNAKDEVVLPILNLIAPVLPQKLGSTFTSGPFPDVLNLLGKALGSSISALGDYMENNQTLQNFNNIWSSNNGVISKITSTLSTGVDVLGNLLTAIVLSGYKNYSYKLEFGNFCTFSQVIYKKASWSFSQEVDQFGYPIAGDVTITFKSLVPVALSSTSTVSKSLVYNTER